MTIQDAPTRAKALSNELPNNIEAEQAVLGSLLVDPECYVEVAFLKPEDFYRDGHRLAFEVIKQLVDAGEPPDLITVSDGLETLGKLQDVQGRDANGSFLEGIPYLASLVGAMPTSGNAAYYAKIVQNMAECRTKIADATKVVESAYRGNVLEARAFVESMMSNTVADHNNSLVVVDDIRNDFLDELDMLSQNESRITGIPTGFMDLDNLWCGLNKSDLIILAARPGLGKSTLTLNIAKNVAMQKKGVALFSLEMGKQQLFRRLMSDMAGIDLTFLKNGKLDDEHWERLSFALAKLDGMPLYLDDTAGISCAEIRNKVKRLMTQQPIDLIIVDYLQLMSGAVQNKGNREQDVSFISRSLKNLARELNIPIIALSQLSRAVESRQNKIPQLSDLRESGSLEQDSDIVAFIYRDDIYNPDSERKGCADIITAKHRNGPIGDVVLYFDGAKCRFADIDATVEA